MQRADGFNRRWRKTILVSLVAFDNNLYKQTNHCFWCPLAESLNLIHTNTHQWHVSIYVSSLSIYYYSPPSL